MLTLNAALIIFPFGDVRMDAQFCRINLLVSDYFTSLPYTFEAGPRSAVGRAPDS